jgi:hypothetical protein
MQEYTDAARDRAIRKTAVVGATVGEVRPSLPPPFFASPHYQCKAPRVVEIVCIFHFMGVEFVDTYKETMGDIL